MKKKMKDMIFEEFKRWCNMRACDGQWSIFAACFYIEAITQVLKVKPLFGRKKPEKKSGNVLKMSTLT